MKVTDENYDIGQDFIWVVSYPKSGNTWMRFVLSYYLEEAIDTEPFESNDTSLYWYQAVSPKPISMLTTFECIRLRSAALMHMQTVFANRHKPAIIKSHMVSGEFHGMPFFCPLWVDKAIYIHRDPRDVLPSMNDHMGHETMEETVKAMSDSTCELGGEHKIPQMISSWSINTESWTENARVPTIVTSYEKMHEDLHGEVEKILKFLELEPDHDAIDVAIERASFENLRKQEEERGFPEKSHKQERFFRRGIIGSHKDEVEPELVKQLEEDHRVMMTKLGYLDD